MSDKTIKDIPHSKHAEEAVIGAVLINPEAFLEVTAFLSAQDFYIHKHLFIWQAFEALFARNTPIDLMTLGEELENAGKLNEIGGPAFITGLITQVPDSLHAVHYGKIIEAHATRRRMINAANTVAQAAYDEKIDILEAQELASAAIHGISNVCGAKDITLGESVSRIYKYSHERAEQGTLPGIPTGFIDLDKLLKGGLQKGRLYLVAGRPSIGKSAEVLDFAVHASQRGKHVRVFSQEMGYEEVAYRVAAKITNIDENRLEIGALEPDEWKAFGDLIEQSKSYPLVIDETKPLTPRVLRSICHRQHLRGMLDLVIVDYIQLMEGHGEKRYEQVGDISRQLKLLAHDLDIPVVAAAQVSRAIEQRGNQRPVLSDLRESGNLESDADVVIFLWQNPDQVQGYGPNVITNIVAKHRNGPLGELELIYRRSITKFENAMVKGVTYEPKPEQLILNSGEMD